MFYVNSPYLFRLINYKEFVRACLFVIITFIFPFYTSILVFALINIKTKLFDTVRVRVRVQT